MGATQHDLVDWRERQTSFDGLAGYYVGTMNLAGTERPVRFEGGFVSANTFDLLGVSPALGRPFLAADDDPAAPLVVIIGHNLWRNSFQSEAAIVGTTLRVNGQEAEVVGVMPPGFAFPAGQDLWLPLRSDLDTLERGEGLRIDVVGRVRDGLTVGQARAELEVISSEIADLHPATNRGTLALVEPLDYRYVDREMRLVLTAMFGSVLLVLAIACANVANLLFVRFAGRERELAVRSALGAGRLRLLVHVLSQCLVISVVAALIGFWLAEAGVRYMFDLLRARWEEQPFYADATVDWRSVLFAALAVVAVTVLAGLVPALRASSTRVGPLLRSGGRGLSGSPLGRMSRALVTFEIALSCVVLVCSGLLVRSVVKLGTVEIGATTDGVLAGRIGLFESVYPEPEDRLRLFGALEERLAALPGVEQATLSTSLPGTFAYGSYYSIEGEERAADARPRVAEYAIVVPGYFQFFEVPVIAGRALRSGDGADASKVAVISDRLAELLGGVEVAVGQRVRLGEGDDEGEWITVVGVVPTVLQGSVRNDTAPTIYLPLAQHDARFMSVALRTAGDPLALAEALRQAVMELDPDLPVYWLRTLDDWVDRERFIPRFLAGIFSLFGVAGLVLAAVGLYGVLAFTVVQRTQEFGLRRALGATGRTLIGFLARESALQLTIGLALGLLLATGFGRLLAGELHGVAPFDPLTYGLVAGALAAAAVVALMLPVRRALAVHPADALRCE
jgi:putative ABC transport system permease protein